jgi:hypothetical protein
MLVVVLILGLLTAQAAIAQEEQSAPPLPLHSIEGTGGVFSTQSAYLVNPPGEGEVFGMPSVGVLHVHMGHGRALDTFTITETLWGRLELGYGFNYIDFGDLPQDIERATGIRISDQYAGLHNINARLAVTKEGDFDQAWLPALTVGVHYKYNDTIDDANDDLMGGLRAIGIDDNDGIDFTLYASKMITNLPRPVMVSAGLRSTEAAHIGLLGFTGDRKVVGEGSICVFATDRLIFAAEYRQKPNEYDEVPGLFEEEDDWWTLCAAYIVNDRMTIGGGYGHFGQVLNHEANSSWGVKIKVEF